MTYASSVPFSQPPLRQWEPASNRFLVAPSDDVLHVMWIGWGVLFACFAAFSFTVWLAILLSRRVRKQAYNFYLLYLMFPDWFFTANCAISCLLNAGLGHYASPGMCLWQSFYHAFGVTSNTWLNAVICFEVHTMLRSSHERRRYFPPTRKKVTRNSLCVYLGAVFLALWGVVDVSWLPHETTMLSGLGCLPQPQSKTQSMFFWCIFMPLYCLIPLGYVVYVVIDIWRRKLLPPRGQRRTLSIYFFRIVAVFVIMWAPAVLIVHALSGVNAWVVSSGAAWAHCQALVSAAVTLLKADIAQATKELITCHFQELCAPEESGKTGFSTTLQFATEGELNDMPEQSTRSSVFHVEGEAQAIAAVEENEQVINDNVSEEDETDLPVAPFDDIYKATE